MTGWNNDTILIRSQLSHTCTLTHIHTKGPGPYSLIPVPSTHTMIEITSINPALPCSMGSQIMQNTCTLCVWGGGTTGTGSIPVVLIESFLADWGRRSTQLTCSFIYTHLFTHRPTQTHTSWFLTPSYTHTCPPQGERYYWIETVGRLLSLWPVWSFAKLSLPPVTHHMYVWAEKNT